MEKTVLEQLKKLREDHDHCWSNGDLMEMEDWKNIGSPYCWVTAEENDSVIVLIDIAYGYMAVLKEGVLLKCSRSKEIVLEDLVILDKEYYNTKKYIWR